MGYASRKNPRSLENGPRYPVKTRPARSRRSSLGDDPMAILTAMMAYRAYGARKRRK